MKGETWCCPQCGEENSREFIICKQCGFVNQPDAEAKLTEKEERSQPSVEKEKEGKKGKIKWIVLITVLLLLLMAAAAGIFWWLSIADIRGLIQDRAYEKAISQAKEKPYCAFLQTEAVEAWVEDLWSKGLYEEAIEVFEQWYEGEDKESRIAALIEGKNNERLDLAREALEKGEWEKADNLLGQVDEGYPEAERLREECLEGKNKERLDLAQEAYDRGEWNLTLTYLDEIEGELPEAEALRTEAIWSISIEYIRSEKTKDAEDYLKQIPELPEAQTYLDILQLMEENRYYEAAQEVQEIPKTAKGLSSSEWKSMLQQRAGSVYEGAELELQIAAIDRPFSGYCNQTAMNPDVPYELPVRQSIDGTILNQEEMFALLKNCEGNGNKKTLILWDMVPYRESKHSYCLAGDVMQSLPESMFPSSWEEVEYIITLNCTAAGESAYYQTVFGRIYAVREQLRVSVRRANKPEGLIYSGQTIVGEPAPDSFSFDYGTNYPFVSSGLPDRVMEQVALMVDYIEKH